MPIEIRKKEGESSAALLSRFSKRLKRSGILKEANKRRFKSRDLNRRKRRLSAIHKSNKKAEYARLKKLGLA